MLPLRTTLFFFGSLATFAAFGQVAVYESEPNNTPETAGRVKGEARIIGEMAPGDQDGYFWTVSDVGARKRWSFELQGIPGAMTLVEVVRLEHAEDDSGISDKTTLLKFGSRDGTRPGRADNLLFEPGEYLLGVARAGGNAGYRPTIDTAGFTGSEATADEASTGSDAEEQEEEGYRLHVRESGALGSGASAKGSDRRDGALPTRGMNRETVTYAESRETWFNFQIEPEQAEQIWDLTAQVPVGRDANLTLEDESGQVLKEVKADREGHMVMPALTLAPGEYFLRLAADSHTLRTVRFETAGIWAEGQEAEPNDTWDQANRVNLGSPLSGRLNSRSDADYFSFALDAEAIEHRLVLEIKTKKPNQKLQSCLLDSRGERMQCRSGKGTVRHAGLVLDPGRYILAVDKDRKNTDYTITLDAEGPLEPGSEGEPNDNLALATGFPAKRRIRGRLGADDQDFFRIMVNVEPQLRRFQAIGEGIREVAYYDGAGKRVQRIRTKGNQRRVRLDNVYLLPGTHYLSVTGNEEGEYTLLARLLGQPDPNAEREPNDDSSRSHRLAIGQTRTGTLADPGDQDYYRFFIANHDHVRLSVRPPADGAIQASLDWYGNNLARHHTGKPGEPITLAGVFPPGDYELALSPKKASDAGYEVQLERLARFSCPADCEPNGMGDLHRAAPLPPSLVLEGRSGDWRDTDVYAMPELAAVATVTVRSSEPLKKLVLSDGGPEDQLLDFDSSVGGYELEVPAGDQHYLIVDSRGKDYRLELDFPDDSGIEPAAEPLAATLQLELDGASVAAYRADSQRVGGMLELRNTGEEPIEVTLEAITSDYRWRAVLASREVALEPGTGIEIPVEVLVPPDAWAERPVRISVAARSAAGALTETWQTLDVKRDIPPVDPRPDWRVPETLRGGFNIAWAPFGAQWTNETPDADNLEYLRDGLVFAGQRTPCCGFPQGWKADYRPEFTLALPGEEAFPVAGMALSHFGSPSPFPNPRRVTLLLSEDGESYEPALTAEILPVQTEQYFALDEPAMAKFARLRVDETFSLPRGTDGLVMGEWKLILEPGFDITKGEGFNVADPELGGHLVHDSPPEFYKPRQVLDEQEEGSRAAADSGQTQDYVIGFHHNRAAQVSRIEWVYGDDVEAPRRFDRVSVSTSLGSSVGPWKQVGELEVSDSESLSVLDLDEPVWARFVRIRAFRKPDSGKPPTEPVVIRVRERPTSGDYRSVLTEWGQASNRAYYEAQRSDIAEPARVASGNRSRVEAAPLVPGERVSGQVALAKYEHWYQLDVPAGQNTLTITLSGEPTVRTIVELQDNSGEVIPTHRIDRDEAARHVFEAVVEPGSEIFLRVYEPPRNVVFSWDTSASVNAYLPLIYKSLVAFSSQVIPGQEAVNLVPFGRGPLLDDWHGEPYVLQTILNEYPRSESSSAAEKTLKIAAEALAPLPGTKYVVLITDADTTPDGTMWRAMREVRPRVFGVQVAGTQAQHQDVFQDWTDVNGGHYKQILYEGEMEVAFDRAATLMRRPAPYSLKVETEFREAPGPGQLLVVSGDGEQGRATAGAIELILDASGSMLQRLEGRRRIAIAREVLTEAVSEHLPPGTPVALRVFGQKEPDACRTDLEIPLGPLDPEGARATIENIHAKNLARTPIADSLARVEEDLAGAEGAKTVVLVTDGEETCDGDPAAVIRDLQDKGTDIHLNIVGFAVDDPELKSTFEDWAELGGGRYFQASDSEGLRRALEESLKAPYSVFDTSGERIAQGIVDGEPLELPAGVYKVAVQGRQHKEFEQVQVPGGEQVSLKVAP